MRAYCPVSNPQNPHCVFQPCSAVGSRSYKDNIDQLSTPTAPMMERYYQATIGCLSETYEFNAGGCAIVRPSRLTKSFPVNLWTVSATSVVLLASSQHILHQNGRYAEIFAPLASTRGMLLKPWSTFKGCLEVMRVPWRRMVSFDQSVLSDPTLTEHSVALF